MLYIFLFSLFFCASLHSEQSTPNQPKPFPEQPSFDVPYLDTQEDSIEMALEDELFDVGHQDQKPTPKWKQTLQQYGAHMAIQYMKIHMFFAKQIDAVKVWWHARKKQQS